ncbi:hypothetical protein ATANTOWER_002645 [Ataeniobius toweri]|uniref:Secreted protein n=1 Tax=Ataeniobius toweri TaxID=208326 RepID=A0ABU7C7D6_9TELE|nr:hypothetical protein [Ataeniobius toweri]
MYESLPALCFIYNLFFPFLHILFAFFTVFLAPVINACSTCPSKSPLSSFCQRAVLSQSVRAEAESTAVVMTQSDHRCAVCILIGCAHDLSLHFCRVRNNRCIIVMGKICHLQVDTCTVGSN